MKVTSVKTPIITANTRSLFDLLDETLPKIAESSVLAISSKIVSLCEGRVVESAGVAKGDLVAREADYYLPKDSSPYRYTTTITRNTFVTAAGIDNSNAGQFYVLWPEDPQRTANEVRAYLAKKYSLEHVGVVITDSTSMLLRMGVSGIFIGFSGFKPLNSYIGKKDLFGHKMHVSRANIASGLAAAAVMVMGEGSEQTPIAVIEDVGFIEFVDRNPTDNELMTLNLTIDDDVYAPLLNSAPWIVGGESKQG
jgi:dihydrofolate synthase / folylpolyglutamate synthase